MSVVDIHKVKGVRPEFDVYIGRAVFRTEFTEASKWSNKHNLSMKGYESHIRNLIEMNPKYYNLEELRNKKLGCWCITTNKIETVICHGQVLLKLLKETEGREAE